MQGTEPSFIRMEPDFGAPPWDDGDLNTRQQEKSFGTLSCTVLPIPSPLHLGFGSDSCLSCLTHSIYMILGRGGIGLPRGPSLDRPGYRNTWWLSGTGQQPFLSELRLRFLRFLFLQSCNQYLFSDYSVLGNVCGHEETAVQKTGTDSALRELIIWVGPAQGGVGVGVKKE